MAVRLGQRSGGDDLDVQHEINVTPFIDVILVLLLIVMVAAPLATVDIGVNLPASTAPEQPRPDKPVFVTGDVVDDLSAAVDRMPADLPLVVFNSSMLPYLPRSRRADFVAALAELAADRPLWWISQESYEAGLNLVLPDRPELAVERDPGHTPLGTLGIVRWRDGKPDAVALARTAFHGERIVWMAH